MICPAAPALPDTNPTRPKEPLSSLEVSILCDTTTLNWLLFSILCNTVCPDPDRADSNTGLNLNCIVLVEFNTFALETSI